MKTIEAKDKQVIALGRVGENNARQISFDLSSWVDSYGDGTASLLVRRPNDTEPYPVALSVVDNMAIWAVTDTDTAQQGYGQAELMWYVGDTLAKSHIYPTFIGRALGTMGEEGDPWADYLNAIQKAGGEATAAAGQAKSSEEEAKSAADVAQLAADKAVNAVAHNPIIKDGTWWTWDTDVNEYRDTGDPAQGEQGPQGEPGKDGGVTMEEVSAAVERAIDDEVEHPSGRLFTLASSGLSLSRRSTYLSDKLPAGQYKIFPCGDISIVVHLQYPSAQQQIILDGGKMIEPLDIPGFEDGEYLTDCISAPPDSTSKYRLLATTNKTRFVKSIDGLEWESVPIPEEIAADMQKGGGFELSSWHYSGFVGLVYWSVGGSFNFGAGEAFILNVSNNKWVKCKRPDMTDEEDSSGEYEINGLSFVAASQCWVYGRHWEPVENAPMKAVGFAYKVNVTNGDIYTAVSASFECGSNIFHIGSLATLITTSRPAIVEAAIDANGDGTDIRVFAAYSGQDIIKGIFTDITPDNWHPNSVFWHTVWAGNRKIFYAAGYDKDGRASIFTLGNDGKLKYLQGISTKDTAWYQFAAVPSPRYDGGTDIIGICGDGNGSSRPHINLARGGTTDFSHWYVTTYTGLDSPDAYGVSKDVTGEVKQLLSSIPTATDVSFDDTAAQLNASDVQTAIDNIAEKVNKVDGLPAVTEQFIKSLKFAPADTNNSTSMPGDAIRYDDNYLVFNGPIVIVSGALWPQLLRNVGTPYSEYLALGTIDGNPLKIKSSYLSSIFFTFFVHYGSMYGNDNSVYLPAAGRIMYNANDNKTYLLISEDVRNYSIQSTPTKYVYLTIASNTIPYSMFK